MNKGVKNGIYDKKINSSFIDVVNNIIIPNKNIINLNNNVLDYSKITSLLTHFMVCGTQGIFLEGDVVILDTRFYYDNYIKNSFIYGFNIQKCEIISSYIEDTKLYISTSVNSKLIKERRLRYKVIMNEGLNGSYVC